MTAEQMREHGPVCLTCRHAGSFGVDGLAPCQFQNERMGYGDSCVHHAYMRYDECVDETHTVSAVDHPAHYTAGGVECIDAIEAATLGLAGGEAFCTGCALKYLWRWKRKGGVEDLEKARWYVDRLIEGSRAATEGTGV